jgi:hypothetical protein
MREETGSALQRGSFEELADIVKVLQNPDCLNEVRKTTTNGVVFELPNIDWDAQ